MATPTLPAHAKTRREQIAGMQRGLLAARDRLRIQYHEEKALDDCRFWHLKEKVKRKLGVHLDLKPQYPPRPLQFPAAYHRQRHLPLFPIFALVTPSHNPGPFLDAAVRSVLDQNYPRLEYVVADAASTDGSRQVLQAHASKLIQVEGAPEAGPAAALNRAFQRAGGEILGYLCADDLLLPGSLYYIADFFSRHPDVDVVYGHRILIDADGADIGRWVLPRHDNGVLSWACFLPPETLYWRRSIWDKVGGAFDEHFQMAHAWDLILRFREAGARFVRLPRFLGAHRLHPAQRSAGDLAFTARAEHDWLRSRCLRRPVSAGEVSRNTFGYLARHLLLDKMYRRGIVRF